MRIDKFLSEMGICSRSEAAKAARRGDVTVDGVTVRRADMHIDPERIRVAFCGQDVIYKSAVVVMLNKPDGYISATEDARDHTVLELLDERCRRLGLFPCGRLDRDTVGLLLLTNDGDLCHRLISPKHKVEKVYYFKCQSPLSDPDRERLEGGVVLDGRLTLPAKLKLRDDRMSGELTLTEGKFHQVKRMLEAVDNKVTYLERIEFASITLDQTLARGEWRYLTADEESVLRRAAELE